MSIGDFFSPGVSPKACVRRLSEAVMTALPGAVQSVIMYGSHVTGSARATSDVNVLLVLDTVTARDARMVGKMCRRWRSARLKVLVVDSLFMRTSADTFPMEFTDIKDGYDVIAGNDCVKDIVITSKNLRHQCETELKIKVLKLRQACMDGMSDGQLARLIVDRFSSFLIVFKNILRIKNIDSKEPGKIMGVLVSEFNLDRRVFTQVLQAWSEKKPVRNPREFVESFLKEMTSLTAKVDAL